MEKIDTAATRYIEERLLDGDDSPEIEHLASICKIGVVGSEFYFEKIFKQNDIHPAILKTFFRFYPTETPIFY